jgi:glutamate 5-kinase
LPVGVVEVVGNFRRGDVVTLVDGTGSELGRGLAEYSDEEATALMGCRSEGIEERLGYRGRSVMVHRDDLVLFDHDR